MRKRSFAESVLLKDEISLLQMEYTGLQAD